jgi:hypothetical protein
MNATAMLSIKMVIKTYFFLCLFFRKRFFRLWVDIL